MKIINYINIRRGFVFFISAIMFSFSSTSQKFPVAKPNVVFIMADDLGYGDLGCYGQEKIITPNIDLLAKEGIRFTQAYGGSSVCAPSRSSLMTGFHNGHNRVRDNLPHGVHLRPNDFTLAELFRNAGYTTGGIGKWGLGIPGTWGVPNQQGFDYWYGHINQDQAHFYYPDYLWENDNIVLLQEMVIDNEIGHLKGNRGGQNTFYTHDLFTEKANEFIAQNRENPFFLYLSYTIPHYSDYPKNSPEHFIVPNDEPYSDKNWSQTAKNYAAMITRLDRDVGRIMEQLKEFGIDENTLIIFTSDNGPYQGVETPIKFFDSNGLLRGGKRDLYEGGIRVPFIARWRNVIPAGIQSDKPIAFWDLFPTFSELIEYPEFIMTDGISFLSDLKGGSSRKHKFLYWDYGHVRPTFKQAVRYGQYKGIRVEREGQESFELYDLENDIGERNNIAHLFPELVEQIQVMMASAYIATEEYPERHPEIKESGKVRVPGAIINHKPASSGVYLGAPSITILPNGDYIVSHNFTSIEGGDHGEVHKTAVFKSSDFGKSWISLTEITNQRWSNLFYHRNALYLMGVDEAFGNIAIRRSTDGGSTWTTPKDSETGILAMGKYHTAPTPVVIHQGRIWRAMEDAPSGRNFRAFMMSAPIDADLLRADSWQISNKVMHRPGWHQGIMTGWLEGNAVVGKEGGIINLLRTEFKDKTHSTGAIMKVSNNGMEISFDPLNGFVQMPGATGKKFTIRKDSITGTYWSLVNWIQPKDMHLLDTLKQAGKIRNTLALTSSKDLKKWALERVVLHHPDVKKHAFQYVDWKFDGDDIILVSRTAFEDDEGDADSFHNANYITFHRIEDFRNIVKP
jgi:arylsulfatase A-like enzyme